MSFVSLGVRAGLVVAISIPLVLAITFVFMEIFGISLQRISLGALVIALGLLVDDAMIAVEMMVKKLEEGWDKFRAATFAYTSTAFPMLTGTLVSVAGFLPVGFAKSGAGEYCFTLFAVVDDRAARLVGRRRDLHALHRRRRCSRSSPPARTVTAQAEGAHDARGSAGVLLEVRSRNRGWVIAGTAGSVRAVDRAVRLRASSSSSRRRAGPSCSSTCASRRTPRSRPPKREVKRFEKMLLADPDIVYHSFYVGSGAVRFYLPLNLQLENANFAQAVVVTKSYEVRDAGARAAREGAGRRFRHADGARRAAGARAAGRLADPVPRQRARTSPACAPSPRQVAATHARQPEHAASSISTGTR